MHDECHYMSWLCLEAHMSFNLFGQHTCFAWCVCVQSMSHTHCICTTCQVNIPARDLVPMECCQMFFHLHCTHTFHPNQHANSFSQVNAWCHHVEVFCGPQGPHIYSCKYAGHCLVACHAQNLYPLDEKTFDQNCLQCLHLWFLSFNLQHHIQDLPVHPTASHCK